MIPCLSAWTRRREPSIEIAPVGEGAVALARGCGKLEAKRMGEDTVAESGDKEKTGRCVE